MVKPILFVVPLGLDTFAVAVAATLGDAGLAARERVKVSLLMFRL